MQVVRQPVPEQANPLHEVIVAGVHAPLPSHLRAGVTVPSVQLAAPHMTDVDANTHDVPVPSHALPQVPGTHAVRLPCGACPAPSVVQWPMEPARSQAWHEPVHAESQHTPSTHCPDVHCPALVHLLPFPTLPQEPFTHGCPWQSVSVPHVVAHWLPVAAHLKGAQVTGLVGLQLPSPSQTDMVTAICVVVLQLPEPQTVPLVYS